MDFEYDPLLVLGEVVLTQVIDSDSRVVMNRGVAPVLLPILCHLEFYISVAW